MTGGRISSNSGAFFFGEAALSLLTVWSKGVESPMFDVGRGLEELEDDVAMVLEDKVVEVVSDVTVVELVELLVLVCTEDELVTEDNEELLEAEVEEAEEVVVALLEEVVDTSELDEVLVALALVAVPLATVAATLA